MKYRVTGTVTISVVLDVEAENAEHATAIACETPTMTLCNGCASASPNGQWVTSGEFDGEPEILEVKRK